MTLCLVILFIWLGGNLVWTVWRGSNKTKAESRWLTPFHPSFCTTWCIISLLYLHSVIKLFVTLSEDKTKCSDSVKRSTTKKQSLECVPCQSVKLWLICCQSEPKLDQSKRQLWIRLLWSKQRKPVFGSLWMCFGFIINIIATLINIVNIKTFNSDILKRKCFNLYTGS